MSKHTPGPWDVVQHNHAEDDLWLSINAGRDGEMRPVIADVKYLTAPDDEQWANARLLAAAPELLAACRMVASMAVSWQPLTPGDIAEVKAAIAKEEGRS